VRNKFLNSLDDFDGFHTIIDIGNRQFLAI